MVDVLMRGCADVLIDVNDELMCKDPIKRKKCTQHLKNKKSRKNNSPAVMVGWSVCSGFSGEYFIPIQPRQTVFFQLIHAPALLALIEWKRFHGLVVIIEFRQNELSVTGH